MGRSPWPLSEESIRATARQIGNRAVANGAPMLELSVEDRDTRFLTIAADELQTLNWRLNGREGGMLLFVREVPEELDRAEA